MSEEAIIIEADSPASESAPYFSRIPSNVANDALPENGRSNISGKISAGMPKNPSTGNSASVITGSTPEDKNIEIETISAHIVGKTLNELVIPFFAPLKKLAK